MPEELLWAGFALVWIFGWAAVWLVRKRAREANAMKRRELVHQERLAAIERGVPLPEIPDLEDSASDWLSPEADYVRALWLRRVSLFLGLVAVATGVGMCAAFYWSSDRGFNSMWTLGLIPILAGTGLLLYGVVSLMTDRPPAELTVDR